MTTNNLKKIGLSLLLIIMLQISFAQGKGEMTKNDQEHFGVTISSITAKWSMSTLMGEAVINGSFKWENADNSAKNQLKYNDFIILKVQQNNDQTAYSWVEVKPTVPKSGKGYGFNTSGSPNWDKVFGSFDEEGNKINCWSAADAKSFWKRGFSVVDFKLIRKK